MSGDRDNPSPEEPADAPAPGDDSARESTADEPRRPAREGSAPDAEPELDGAPEADLSAAEQRKMLDRARALRAEFVAEARSRNFAYGDGDAFGGDKIAGDKNFYFSTRPELWRIGPISEERWRDIHHRFAGTPTKEELIELLHAGVVAILQGPPHTGRTTTALAALAHLHRDLNIIRSDESPATLDKDNLRYGHAYLYNASGAAWAKHLSEADVLACRDLLGTLDARMVILVGLDSDTAALPGLVVDHHRPEPLDVLGRQLSDRLPGYDLTAILDQIPDRPTTPGGATEIARALARGLPTGQSVSDICKRMPAPLRSEAREVLRQRDDSKDLGRRAFVIAGAVLDGMSTVQVCRAAYDLAKRLFKVERRVKRAKLGLLPFADMLDDWLGYAREEPSHVIQVVDRKLSFRAGFGRAVLDAVWLDYIVAHQALLDWLSVLAEDGDPITRVKVAQALTRFAKYDFAYIDRHCITDWSESQSQALHMAAAWTLEAIVAECPERRSEVADRAREWALHGDLRQRSTAVRLLGPLLGGEAMKSLYQLAWRHPVALSTGVRNAVVDLFAGSDSHVVLAELLAWIGSPHPGIRRLVADCLTEIARLPGASGPPPLLVRYRENPDVVADLWRKVLTSPQCGQDPWNALRAWADDKVDFASLRHDLYAERALRPRLRFYRLAPSVNVDSKGATA